MIKAITRMSLLLLIIGTSYLGFEAKACTCAPQRSPYREYQDARIVFVGKVTGSKDVAVTENIRDKTYTAYERVFQFIVSESLKGLKTSTIEINVGRIDSSCYQGFAVGESYLVYAFGSSDSLRSGACSRTNNLSFAEDDLHYIRDLLKGVPEPKVYGSVMRVDSDLASTKTGPRVTPLKGIKILIQGKDKTFEAVTNEQGMFSLARIPDGKYKAQPLLPEKYRAYFPEFEEFILGSPEQFGYERIQQGSSAYASFRIAWNNHLSGRIVDSEGNPVVRAKASVLIARSPSPLVIERDAYDHRPEGKFQFSGLNPGNYLLCADIRAPFVDNDKVTTFYHPNAIALDQAREISINESETVDEREIRLPPGYLVRQIEGVLVWPNGVPVADGWVFLAASKDSTDDDEKYDWGSTDTWGRFSLQAFVGAKYWVHAQTKSSGNAEPIEVKVKMINETLKIVVPFPKRIER